MRDEPTDESPMSKWMSIANDTFSPRKDPPPKPGPGKRSVLRYLWLPVKAASRLLVHLWRLF